MDAIRPESELALEPLDAPSAENRALGPADGEPTTDVTAQRDLRMSSADEFLAAAMKEYEEGHVDSALWSRASAQSGDDESLAVAAYLSARATALQLQERDRRLARRASRARSGKESTDRSVEPQSRPDEAVVHVRAGTSGRFRKPVWVAAAAAALASVMAVALLVGLPQKSELGTATASQVVPSATKSTPAGRGAEARPVAPNSGSVTSEADQTPTIEATVQQLKDAANWNVLVLYASKWTRDEPNNAAAWKELSIGYENLRQFDDAVVAATKAAELSPTEALLWRNVGHLNVTLDRLPEAASAFDRALAISNADADALCGAALVAQRSGQMKEADAIARQVKSTGGTCPGASDGESVTVAARTAAPTKPGSSARR